ncbi:hypothetical protein CPB84DRAFT_1108317 [Gymnopilus junonius]|uniref:Uncharacterized protein n=1 Tax=Gymnopilus junonius TaxID=109634 RepID=A0A9P5NQ20_GYMJU|nr:hypothetical protein CPB84DRAFT_1108317 [Gymnopilus junonius]
MCRDEVYGDWYRGCSVSHTSCLETYGTNSNLFSPTRLQHFVKSYYSGERIDCNSPTCGLSVAHVHTAPNCPCPKVATDERRIQSMFHKPCDDCRNAEFARRVGR